MSLKGSDADITHTLPWRARCVLQIRRNKSIKQKIKKRERSERLSEAKITKEKYAKQKRDCLSSEQNKREGPDVLPD